MNIIDKLFSKLHKEKTPQDLRTKILSFGKSSAQPVEKRSWMSFMSAATILRPVMALVLVLVLAGGVYWQFFRVSNLASAFELKAESVDNSGIPANGAFILKSSKSITSFQLKRAITFDPETEFDVSSLGNNTFRIKPKNDLVGDKIYKIKIAEGVADHDYSWAYQVKAQFLVIGTTPGNKGTYVPVNTGIEVTLNREGAIAPEKFFEISPKVDGKFEVHGDTFVFIPKALDEAKVYTVTVKKGMTATGTTDTLAKDYTFNFETDSSTRTGNSGYFDFQRDFEQELPDKKPTVGLFYYNFDPAKDIQNVDVYKYTKTEDFLNSYSDSRNWDYGWTTIYRATGVKADVSKAQKLSSFKPVIQTVESQSFFELPDSVPAGYYLVDATTTLGHKYMWLQVTPVAQYYSVTHDTSLLWARDFTSKSAVTNAKVNLVINKQASKIATTDGNGLAQFSTPDPLKAENNNTTPVFFTVESNNAPTLVVQVQDRWGGSGAYKGDVYWKYLTTDRPIYQMTDTMNFWGVAKGRTQDLKNKNITVGLYNGYFYAGDQLPVDSKPLLSQEVTISDFDTYEGKLGLKGMQPGTYALIATNGKEIITSISVEVLTYTKPAYSLEVTSSKDYIYAGDPVTFTVKAKFFDGTPVGKMDLSYNTNWGDTNGKLTLDSLGTGRVTITPPYEGGAYSYYPRGLNISFIPVKSEEGEISGQTAVLVFGPHMYLQGSQDKQNGNHYEFSAKLNDINLDRTTPKDGISSTPSYEPDYIAGSVTNYPLHAKITKIYYVQVETGQAFDPISKTVYKTYRYDRHDEVVDEFDGVTDTQGTWHISKDLNKVKDGYYVIDITGKDRVGRSLSTQFSAYTEGYYSAYDNYNPNNPFAVELRIPNVRDEQRYSKEYSVGEDVTLNLGVITGKLENNSQVLYYGYQNNITRVKVTDSSTYTDKFTKEFLPNMQYRAVVLGPTGFVETNTVYANFKRTDRELNVAISPDKDSYRPGETVKIDLKVTDKDKKGVSAQVNVAGVDEAIFHISSVSNYQYQILDSLYQTIYTQPIVGYTNYNVLGNPGGGAEKGGGGGDAARANFKDTAVIKTVTTGGSGEGSLQFTLPDNITSWRVTARAYDSTELRAGESQKLVASTLPFFVDATMNQTYLVGDKPVLKVRAYGTAYDTGKPVEFSVKSSALKLDSIKLVNDGLLELPLGSLPVGNYEIRIGAKQGNLSDAVIRKITVIGSYFRKGQSATVTMKQGNMNIAGNPEGVTTIVFADEGLGKYYDNLRSVAWSSGIRSDQIVSVNAAQLSLSQYFGTEKPDPIDLGAYQRNGGFSLLTYNDSDLLLSAKIADLAPGSVQRGPLVKYFNEQMKVETAAIQRTVTALYGLASLNEPVLSKLQSIQNSPDLDTTDKVYVALALAKFGDTENARALYNGAIRPKLTFNGLEAYASFEKDKTKQVKITGSIAELAGQLGIVDDSDKLLAYMDTHYPERDLDVLERVLAVNARLTQTDRSPAKFTYTVDGKSENVELKNGETKTIELTRDSLNTLAFSGISGKVSVTSFYEATTDPSKVNKNNNISIERSYLVNGSKPTELHDGDIVKVSLTPRIGKDALPGDYQLVDFLPSGLKPVTDPYTINKSYSGGCDGISYPTQVVNGTLYFNVYGGYQDPHCPDIKVNYYARVVSKGDFTANPALIQSTRDLEYLNISNTETVHIK